MKLNLDSRFTRTGLWLTGGCALLAVVVAYLVTAAYGYGFSYFLIVALLLFAGRRCLLWTSRGQVPVTV